MICVFYVSTVFAYVIIYVFDVSTMLHVYLLT